MAAMYKWIILIGGVTGTGKSTISRLLCHKLHIDHRLGSGWVREILRAVCNKERYAALFDYSFTSSTLGVAPYDNLYEQSLVMKPSIEACIERARREGSSLIVEGVNLVPGVIDHHMADFYFVLKASDSLEEHKSMLFGETHDRRKLSEKDIENIREMEQRWLAGCREEGVPTVEFADNETRIAWILSYMAQRKEKTNGD